MNKLKIFNTNKNKIIEAKKLDEAKKIMNMSLSLTNDKEEESLLKSLINENRYNSKMELKKFINYLDILDIIYYENEAQEIFKEICQNTNDKAQLNSIIRIIKRKPQKLINQNVENSVIQLKNCPHCNKKNIAFSNIYYIVCGFTDKGFDWKGCGKDWCFKCEKKLCKSWNYDMLFDIVNRKHDGKCCKLYASKIGDKYPDNYCHCNNEFVNRNI